ncbi:MAG: hypothetical protein HY392_04155 [Candidatus Diapherotrites archaeon]|nr:hypothetical protein [Candidatus Diapherotrites archaeon]
MKTRGQIVSLDYVISLILIMLAIGLLLNFFELQAVNAKEAQLENELKSIAQGATRLALASPDIACILTNNADTKDIGVLPNCIPSEPGRLTKEKLGIPAWFGCAIMPAGIFTGTGCLDETPDDVENYYSMTRKILVKNGAPDVNKLALEKCVNSVNCPLADANLTIAVWRQ